MEAPAIDGTFVQEPPAARVNVPAYDLMVDRGLLGSYRIVQVPFAGRGGTGALTWGQERIAALAAELYPWSELNQGIDGPLPPGLSAEQLFAAVRALVERYEGLRTVCVSPPVGSHQRIVGVGRLAVAVLNTSPEHVEEVTRAAVAAVAQPPFEVATELPIRAALVTLDGAPHHLAISVSHVIADFTSVAELRQHLIWLLTGSGDPERRAAAVYQPLEQAAFEQSPAGRRIGDRALRHFETVLRQIPQSMVPRPVAEFQQPRFRYLQFRSRALAIAADTLAVRHRVSSTAVLHAGLCAVAGYTSGLDRSLLQTITNTRADAKARQAVGVYTQSVPTYVDLADASMADVITRSGVAVMAALFHGRHREAEMNKLRRTVEVDRGISLDLSCWINDRRTNTSLGNASQHEPSAQFLRDAAEMTSWQWVDGDNRSTSTYFVHVDTVDGGALRLTMLVDTSLIPNGEALLWMQSLERLLHLAVFQDVTITDIGLHTELAPFQRYGNWSLVDSSWVDVSAVTELVRKCSGVSDADVVAEPSVAGDNRLVAYLGVLRPHSVDLSQLRAACLAEVPGRRTVMIPHEFVVCGEAPRRGDLAGWNEIRVVQHGSGKPAQQG